MNYTQECFFCHNKESRDDADSSMTKIIDYLQPHNNHDKQSQNTAVNTAKRYPRLASNPLSIESSFWHLACFLLPHKCLHRTCCSSLHLASLLTVFIPFLLPKTPFFPQPASVSLVPIDLTQSQTSWLWTLARKPEEARHRTPFLLLYPSAQS